MSRDGNKLVSLGSSKAEHAIAVAECGRRGENRYFDEIQPPPRVRLFATWDGRNNLIDKSSLSGCGAATNTDASSL